MRVFLRAEGVLRGDVLVVFILLKYGDSDVFPGLLPRWHGCSWTLIEVGFEVVYQFDT